MRPEHSSAPAGAGTPGWARCAYRQSPDTGAHISTLLDPGHTAREEEAEITLLSGSRGLPYDIMHQDIDTILLSPEDIRAKVAEMGERITREYSAVNNLLLVGVLKGCIMFMVDLARAIALPLSLDFIAISSYGQSTESSGVVRVLKDLDTDIADQHVLIVEDIIDSGLTLDYLRSQLLRRNPASLRICALLNKPERRISDVPIDYLGFDIPNEFVVGYGLDYGERYRNLPYIGVLKAEIYST